MALPGDVTTFTLNFGPYTDAEGLAALVASGGKLFFVDPSTNRKIRLTHVTSGQVIVPDPVSITIGSDGTGSVGPIPHTGQAAFSPQGAALRVEWNIASNKPSPGNLTFVVPSGATADFDLLVPADTVPAVAISQPTVASVNGQTGAVVIAGLPPTGGAGGALSGTYPSPGLNVTAVDNAVAGAIADGASATSAAAAAFYTPRGLLDRRRPLQPQTDVFVTGFASGHGWTNNGLALFQADATNYVFGTRALLIGSNTTGGYTEKTGLTLDLTGRDFRIWFQLANVSLGQEFSFFAGDATMANGYKWTITTPGGDAQQIAKSNEMFSLVLNLQDAQVIGTPTPAAITTLRFFIQSTTTVNYSAILGGVALVKRAPAFPNGVVSFGFDDSYSNHFTAARPALDTRGYAGTAYTIVGQLDTTNFMTSAQLRHLHDRCGWDVAAHADTLANHDAGFPALTTAALEAGLRKIRAWEADNGYRGADHIAYPLGAVTAQVASTVGKFYASARTTSRQTREVPRPAMPLRMRAVNVTNTDSVASLTAMIDKAYDNGGWLQFCFHQLVNTASASTHYLTTDFQQVVNYCATKGIPVRTVSEVLAAAA